MAFLYNILGTYMWIYFFKMHPPFLKCKNWKSKKQIFGGKKFLETYLYSKLAEF